MARPKKDIQRTYEMKVRMTEAERAIIRQHAKQTGLSMAEYLRERGLEHVLRSRLTTQEVATFRHLAGMANNLNQLTRHANEGKPLLEAEILSTLQAVQEMLSKLK